MPVEVTVQTGIFSWPISVALTCELQTLVMCAIHHPIMANIYTNEFCNPSQNEQNIAWTYPDAHTHDCTQAHTLNRQKWQAGRQTTISHYFVQVT